MEKPKVTEISPTFFEVLNHRVKIQTRKGRKLILCSCQNHTRFCLENPFCYHKELVLEHIFKKPIKDKLDKLIKVYQNWCDLKLPQNPELMLNDLKNLRRILLK